MHRPKTEGEISRGGRPKNLTGVNELCQTCARDCKQAAHMEVISCPSYQARATPGDREAAADKGLMMSRPQRSDAGKKRYRG